MSLTAAVPSVGSGFHHHVQERGAKLLGKLISLWKVTVRELPSNRLRGTYVWRTFPLNEEIVEGDAQSEGSNGKIHGVDVYIFRCCVIMIFLNSECVAEVEISAGSFEDERGP